MSSLIEPEQIKDETEIIWLEEIDSLDYVRQALDRLPGKTARPSYLRPGRMVGYAVLGPKAKGSRESGKFLRRVFWVAPHDRDQAPHGVYSRGAPSEAVDPRTLAPGYRGHKTERSEGGPPSQAMRELGIGLPQS
ncbi:DUF6009 family protein (plasmid) [Streptomycetaceae bacterium NBC_01309]